MAENCGNLKSWRPELVAFGPIFLRVFVPDFWGARVLLLFPSLRTWGEVREIICGNHRLRGRERERERETRCKQLWVSKFVTRRLISLVIGISVLN